MKLRKRIIKCHVALKKARLRQMREDRAFWSDPMTDACGCADEIGSDRDRAFRKRQKDLFFKMFDDIMDSVDIYYVFNHAKYRCGQRVSDSLISAWLGEG